MTQSDDIHTFAPLTTRRRCLVGAADDHEPINVVVNWTALLPSH